MFQIKKIHSPYRVCLYTQLKHKTSTKNYHWRRKEYCSLLANWSIIYCEFELRNEKCALRRIYYIDFFESFLITLNIKTVCVNTWRSRIFSPIKRFVNINDLFRFFTRIHVYMIPKLYWQRFQQLLQQLVILGLYIYIYRLIHGWW